MQSRTSWFNYTVVRKNLSRGWPLWLAYTLLWMIIMPLSIVNSYYNELTAARVASNVMSIIVQGGAVIVAFYAIFAAIVLHSYLYNSRTINTMASLPVRRETVFGSLTLVALLVVIVPNLLVSLATIGAGATLGLNLVSLAFEFFAVTTLTYIFCYGVAALCAALVGHILALPVLYTIVHFMAIVLNYLVANLLAPHVYGMSNNIREENLSALKWSPLYQLCSYNNYDRVYEEVWKNGDYTNNLVDVFYNNWNYLILVASVGVLFLVGAFFLQKYRHMEMAGDVVAVKPLRRVFKYCFATGCAVVLGYGTAAVLSMTYNLAGLIACLVFGGFIGYFLAEIMLQKSFNVWKKEWIGFGVFSAVVIASMASVQFDPFGYEAYVPDLEQVESVQFANESYYYSEDYYKITDETLIYDVSAFHQQLISNKDSLQNAMDNDPDFVQYATIIYTLEGGKTAVRSYAIPYTFADLKDKTSLIYQMGELYNDPALIRLRTYQGMDMLTRQDFVGGSVEYGMDTYDEMTGEEINSREALELSSQEAYDLYMDYVLPDLEDGVMGYDTDFKTYETSWDTGRTAIYFYVNSNRLRDDGTVIAVESADGYRDYDASTYSFVVYEDSTRTAPYLESLDIPIYQTPKTNPALQ